MTVSKTVAIVFLFLFALPGKAMPEVQFSDALVVKGSVHMLKARTKGMIFAEGGKLVTFEVNGKELGTSLSGGDGFAFIAFEPKREGLYTVKVTSSNFSDTGYILSLEGGTEIVLIGLSGTVAEGFIEKRPLKGSREAISRINEKYRVVYISSEQFLTAYFKDWLRNNDFPEAPVLSWSGGKAFKKAYEEGFVLRTVIGSPEVAESGLKYGAQMALCFAPSKTARQLADWEEAEKTVMANRGTK